MDVLNGQSFTSLAVMQRNFHIPKNIEYIFNFALEFTKKNFTDPYKL